MRSRRRSVNKIFKNNDFKELSYVTPVSWRCDYTSLREGVHIHNEPLENRQQTSVGSVLITPPVRALISTVSKTYIYTAYNA
jgi:hypothetical protein